ncbi:substrate-binding periplasmic protein [Bdellovibrio sp. HCB337]|uniref:substrate-binding periplasmic protein n=1 Tax=Bdellovibrio sp. HCB337 TaxID=3394358 RepID=UPI0039A68E44
MRLLFLLLMLVSLSAVASEATQVSFSTQENYTQIPVVTDLTKFIAASLEKEKIKVNFVPMPLMRGTISVENGEVDGEMGRDLESMKSFSHIMTTSRPFMFANIKMIYLKSRKIFSTKNLSQLQAVTLLNNHTIVQKLKDDNLKFLETKYIPQALTVLEQKRADYFLLSEVIILGFFETDPKLKEKFVIADENFMVMPLYLTLNKKKADLMPRIEKALRAGIKSDLKKYPRLQTIINKDF